MTRSALKLCVPQPGQHWSPRALDSVIPCLERQDAGERIRWALDYLPAPAIMTSSFGAQSAVMLHLTVSLFIRPTTHPFYNISVTLGVPG